MITVCHLLAIDERTQLVQTRQTPLGWVFPTVLAPAGATHRELLNGAATWVGRSTPRCLGEPTIDVRTKIADLTVVVDTNGGPIQAGMTQVPLATLDSHRAIVPYQASAVHAVQHADRQTARFLAAPWRDEVTEWVAARTHDEHASLLRTLTLRRALPDRAVMRFRTGEVFVYFKARLGAPHIEAMVTALMAAVSPAHVVRPLAFDRDRGWWLTEHVNGVELTGTLWPRHHVAAETWLDLQVGLLGMTDAIAHCGTSSVSRSEMWVAATAAIDDVLTLNDDERRTLRRRVNDVLDRWETHGGPMALLHLDAAPRNILWADTRAVFLDLESACLGPAIAFPELLARKMRTTLATEQLRALRQAGAQRASRRFGLDAHMTQTLMAPMADLLLLVQRRWHAEHHRRNRESAAAYVWRHVAADFVSRIDGWPAGAN